MLTRMVVVALLAIAMNATAQDGGRRGGRDDRFRPEFDRPGEPRIIGGAPGAPGPVVRGAPYSATMVTETTQVLPDGNRIRQTTTSRFFRDSEGRVRSETSLSGLGFLSPALAGRGGSAPMVFITDPVAGVSYVLNLRDKSYTKSRVPGGDSHPAGPGSGPGVQRELRPPQRPPRSPRMREESLGRQTLEGVVGYGRRSIMTIAAGQIGNEQPIQIISERWYSPELRTVLMSRHSDPRSGETVFRLVNINRSEQPASLFQPPADYRSSDWRGSRGK
jgi:hypothetical protein